MFLISMSLVIFCLLFSFDEGHNDKIKGGVEVGEGGGTGWGGVEGWGENVDNCN